MRDVVQANSFELFDHTADIGLRVRADSMPGLIEPATRGLYAAIGALQPGRSAGELTIDLHGTEAPVLLRDYLDELLVLFDRDHRCVSAVKVEAFDEQRLRAALELCDVDDDGSVYHREVKAVTYHQLDIRRVADGYEASLILDI